MPPDTYTHGHSEGVLRSHRWRTAANSAPHLLPHLRPGLSLLDVGCGPGTITLDLARAVAPGQVLAVDAAAEVLVEPAARAGELGLAVEFAVGDAYALDLPDDSVDVVHAHQVLQHLGDPVAALREMRRVCRPGGLVAVRDADYAAMTWFPASPGLDRWREVYDAVTRGNGAEPDAGRHLRSWALAAGLTDLTCSAGAWCFAEPADRAWWGGLWAERLRTSDLAEQAVERGVSDRAELEELAAAWLAWAAAEDGWFAVLHGEVLARV